MAGSGLLERDEAVGAVTAALDAARAGRASAVFVVGEAGLGKTALVDHAIYSATGFEVLVAHGEAIDVVLPFGYLTQILSGAGAGDLLMSSTSGLPAGERPAAAWAALCHWLDKAGRDPRLVVLDDLQWADADSLVLLELLVRHLPDRAVGIVGAVRPWPQAAVEAMSALANREAVRLVRLAPLSSPAAVTLLSRLTGHAPDAHSRALLDTWCGGNPLLVHEFARSLHGDGALASDNGPLGVASSVDAGPALLLGRFTGLDARGLDFARAAAVLGVQFAPPVAACLAGLTDLEVGTVLGALCRSGLMRQGERPGVASFTHALLRQALYDDLPSPVRAHLHAGAFGLLWDRGAPAGEAAAHVLAANLVGDPDAVTAVARAGLDALALGALDAAARWLEAAVRLAGERAEPELRLRLAEALHASGAAAAALEVCRRLVAEANLGKALSARAKRLGGVLLFELGETSLAAKELRAAAAEAVACGDRGLAIEALLEGAVHGSYAAGPRQALGFVTDAHALLDADTDPQLAGWVTLARGHVRMLMADPGGPAEVEAGLALLPGRPGLRGLHGSTTSGPLLVVLQTAKLQEDFDAAVAAFARATVEAARDGVPLLSIYAVAHADTLCRCGRLTEARDVLQASDDSLWRISPLPWSWVGLAHVHFELDEAEQAESYCTQIETMLGAQGDSLPLLRFWLWRVRASLALQDLDPDLACELMDRCRDTAERSGTHHPCAVTWHPVAITSYLRAGRLDDAEAVVGQLEAVLAAVPCRWPRAIVARGRAMLAERSGRPDEAEGHYQDALSWHDGLPMPLEHAETLLCYGELLRRRGTTRHARRILNQAVGIAADTGARRLERLARVELHAAGGRRRNPTYSQELTAAQHRVASLAASGLTNAEIGHQLSISARTVEHHLSRIYNALGVTNRRQLRRYVEGESTANSDLPPPHRGKP